VKPSSVHAYDVFPGALQSLSTDHGVQAAPSVSALAAQVDVVLLATKPHDVPAVLAEIAASGTSREDLLVISVAAGLTVATLEQAVGTAARLIRAMPNTPALIGKGAAAFTRGTHATDADAATAAELLGAVGLVIEVRESLMDAVTGLSGSGPAYVYVLIEALADGGVQNGLPREQARDLAVQTVLGAAAMVQSTGTHPAVLKDMVSSPGGTTIAGIHALEQGGLRAAFMDAIIAATERSRELGR
jgi:pyrroline-5-carboxylate reductase